jgi:ABC-type polysaccharide/polyol phosphate export permease
MIPSQYQTLYRLNPMTQLITAYRAILLEGAFPNPLTLLVIGLLTTGLVWFGYRVFVRASYRFVEEL